MKTTIHPQWFAQASVVCACGSKFTVGSTKTEIRVEICSQCHPFFTGEQRFTDSIGNVDRFVKRREKAEKLAPVLQKKKDKKAGKVAEVKPQKSLREMLMGA